MPKKTERQDPLGVFNIHFVAKLKKMGTLWGKSFFFPKKVSYNIGTLQNENKPGPAQVGAISQAQK